MTLQIFVAHAVAVVHLSNTHARYFSLYVVTLARRSFSKLMTLIETLSLAAMCWCSNSLYAAPSPVQ